MLHYFHFRQNIEYLLIGSARRKHGNKTEVCLLGDVTHEWSRNLVFAAVVCTIVWSAGARCLDTFIRAQLPAPSAPRVSVLSPLREAYVARKKKRGYFSWLFHPDAFQRFSSMGCGSSNLCRSIKGHSLALLTFASWVHVFNIHIKWWQIPVYAPIYICFTTSLRNTRTWLLIHSLERSLKLTDVLSKQKFVIISHPSSVSLPQRSFARIINGTFSTLRSDKVSQFISESSHRSFTFILPL